MWEGAQSSLREVRFVQNLAVRKLVKCSTQRNSRSKGNSWFKGPGEGMCQHMQGIARRPVSLEASERDLMGAHCVGPFRPLPRLSLLSWGKTKWRGWGVGIGAEKGHNLTYFKKSLWRLRWWITVGGEGGTGGTMSEFTALLQADGSGEAEEGSGHTQVLPFS